MWPAEPWKRILACVHVARIYSAQCIVCHLKVFLEICYLCSYPSLHGNIKRNIKKKITVLRFEPEMQDLDVEEQLLTLTHIVLDSINLQILFCKQ